MSEYSQKIEYFAAAFGELQQSLDRGLWKHTAFTATRTEFVSTQILKVVQDSGVYASSDIHISSHQN
jgi:hypothetical protein